MPRNPHLRHFETFRCSIYVFIGGSWEVRYFDFNCAFSLRALNACVSYIAKHDIPRSLPVDIRYDLITYSEDAPILHNYQDIGSRIVQRLIYFLAYEKSTNSY